LACAAHSVRPWSISPAYRSAVRQPQTVSSCGHFSYSPASRDASGLGVDRFLNDQFRTCYHCAMARPRKFVEDEVIAAARVQFWTHGYAATSLDDLVAVTGLGRGSLYRAFGDKHALFMRALDQYCAAT